MSALGAPWVASAVAWGMQHLATAGFDAVARRRGVVFPEFPGDTQELTIPTSPAPARTVVYRPAGQDHVRCISKRTSTEQDCPTALLSGSSMSQEGATVMDRIFHEA